MSKKSVVLQGFVVCSSLLVCGVAQAAVAEDSAAPVYRMGGVSVYPGMALVEKSDSNIFRSSATDPARRSSMITVLSPSVLLQADKAASTFSLAYNADIGRYSKSTADNYVDQNFLASAEMGMTTRTSLILKPAYSLGHDDRGTTFGAATAEPNKYRSSGVSGSFIYGAEEARGRIALDAGYTDRQYRNNRVVTIAYDKTLRDVGGTFYYSVAPKTSLLIQAKDTRIAYKDAASVLSGNERRYLVGATWEATAQTSGTVKVGQLRKKFDSGLPAFSGASWEADVLWSPREYARVNLLTSRQPSESTLAGSSFVLVSNTGADIAYDLNERITLHVNGSQVKEDFRGSVRVDSTNNYGVKAEYNLRSWLVAAAEYSDSKKTSSVAGNDYKRNIFMLSLRTKL